MEKAIKRLNDFLQKGEVHATRSILSIMLGICSEHKRFFGDDLGAQQDFAQKCRNFEIFSQSINKTSWGREQFEQWWNEGTVTPDKEVMAYARAQKFFSEGSVPDEDAPPEFPMIYTGIPYEDKWKEARIQELFDQIEWCDYVCQAGKLTLNTAYIELKRRLQ